jgi:hypothetical protein
MKVKRSLALLAGPGSNTLFSKQPLTADNQRPFMAEE